MSDNGEHGSQGLALGGRDAELEDMAQDPQRLGQSDSRKYSALWETVRSASVTLRESRGWVEVT